MASEAEVLQVTGYRVGAVSPFGTTTVLKVLVDPSVLKESEISLGSGIRGVAIMIKSADLLSALSNYEVLQLLE